MRASTSLAAALGGLLGVAACAPPTPRAALDAYAGALRAGDAAEVHRRTDPDAGVSAADVAARLTATGTAAAGLATALEGAALTVYAEGRTADGRAVRLVRTEAGWRVAAGGLDFVSAQTPEAALATLWRAAAAGRLDDVRAVMPSAARARWASDAELRRHLAALAPRLAAARAALSPLAPGRATVDGARARLRYGDGRSVRWVLEDGGWRVVDVE